MLRLQKSGLINDPVLREHYDWLVHLAERIKRSGEHDSYYFAVVNMIRGEAHRHGLLADQETPPPHVLIDDRVCPWQKLRTKSQGAAEAFRELAEWLEGNA